MCAYFEPVHQARRAAIIGAGQAGLVLGTSLLGSGHAVNIWTNRSAEDLRTGAVMSSQCLFASSLDIESRLGLNFWGESCPRIRGMRVSAALPGDPSTVLTRWSAQFNSPAMSVDQRLKMATWLENIELRGARITIEDIDQEKLGGIAAAADLTFVTAGKSDLVGIFPTDGARTGSGEPQRHLAMFYVHDSQPDDDSITFHAVPGVGEFLSYPALTLTGRCRILLLEIVPGSPIDIFDRAQSIDVQLTTLTSVIHTWFPAMIDFLNQDLIDDGALLIGAVRPTVRRPWTTVNGHTVAAVGDAQCVNDPITAQGANNATKAAAIFGAHFSQSLAPFTPELIDRIHAHAWAHIGPAAALTEQFLGDKPDYAQMLHIAAGQHPLVAHRFAELMNDPRDALSWALDPDGARAYLEAVRASTFAGALSA